MEEEKKDSIWGKVQTGRKYRVWRKDFNGKTFYNFLITQKEYDGTESKYYIPVTFKKGVEIDNETDIIIHHAIENYRMNKNLKDGVDPKYYPISSFMITNFEIVENKEQSEAKAYDKFKENLNENEISIDDSQLPF